MAHVVPTKKEGPVAPENLEFPFASPFAAGSPFSASRAEPAQDADTSDEVEAIDGDEDVTDGDSGQGAPAGAAFGLVFQAADPMTRVPRRSRRADDESPRDEAPAARGGGDDADDEAYEQPRPARSRSRRRRGDDAQHDENGDASSDDAAQSSREDADEAGEKQSADTDDNHDENDDELTPRRRRRGGRGRRGNKGDDASDGSQAQHDDADGRDSGSKGGNAKHDDAAQGDGSKRDGNAAQDDGSKHDDAQDDAGSRKRTRRRRRSGSGQGSDGDDANTVTKVREPRRAKDEITSIKGSVRLEAKKQRRREGREAGRRRTVITEAEFLARRESVERVMVVREQEGRTQIGVLEDGVLAEHYVSRQEQASSMAGNVYLGRVQNVLPSMEAAFVDIGRGRNAVLYAGEVNWDAAGLDNQPKRIEHALKAGESVLVQVTKDPIGHKGARLTSQISLPGRFVVFVPGNSMTGISRKLPDTERARLKRILKEVVPADAGVIVRTAAEGASEEELRADVERLMKMWERIQAKAETANAPSLLHGEPDLTVRVIRDVFNEDFAKMVVSGERAWNEVHTYISEVAPDLVERLEKWEGDEDVFAEHRIDEQLAKAMDRKVWLPSGGSLVIDRTEAMTVVDVNTGKFVGSGGNLEETVTKNNIEAAEEIVRQLRLRDIGGIIVVDFIDMVLEANRELVVRRLLECLGRDRTKHQVAEVTSLGLVQMTRKRVGAGLVEVFSETCESCQGRGIVIHDHPVENRDINGNDTNRKGRGGRGGRGGRDTPGNGSHGSTGGSNGGQHQGRQDEAGESKAERDNGFAQIAAAAHAAAISAGDKSATSKPVSTASDDDAVMTVSPQDGAGSAEAAPETSAPKKSGTRRSGRVKPRSERVAQAAADASTDAGDVTSAPAANEGAAADIATNGTTVSGSAPADAGSAATATASTAQAPTARRRGSRRAAASTGAPARAGEASVMTVPAASASASTAPSEAFESGTSTSATPSTSAALASSGTDTASTDGPTLGAASTSDAPANATSSAVVTSSAGTTPAPMKRPRRRAGSSAGAPVTLQPVDLSAPASSSAPLTKVAGEDGSASNSTGSTTTSDATTANDTATAHNTATASNTSDAASAAVGEQKAPARKKRARVSSPAGAPAPKAASDD
ncbi:MULTISPECIES: ribonuclease E/G [Dermacoccus]|nr:ribonuclease E/G [Dermacoccus nishinomiyaensis]